MYMTLYIIELADMGSSNIHIGFNIDDLNIVLLCGIVLLLPPCMSSEELHASTNLKL